MRPKKFKVEGEQVDVVFRARLTRFKDGYPTAGKHTPASETKRALIEIGPGQTHDDERRTLLHEMLHDAAVRGNARSFVKIRDEEAVITAIEPWLFATLQENPDLVAWLLEAKPE